MQTKVNNKFLKQLKAKGYNDDEILKISYAIFLLSNDRLNEEIHNVLSEEEYDEYTALTSDKDKHKYLSDILKNKKGKNFENIIDDIFSEIESEVLNLTNQLDSKFK